MNILINKNFTTGWSGLFENDGEWIHPAVTNPTYEIIYVTRGEVFLEERGREYCLRQGQLLILSPHTLHRGTRGTEKVGFYWLHFGLTEGELPFETRFFEQFSGAGMFREYLHLQALPTPPDYLLNSLLMRILAELCHLSGEWEPKINANAEKIYEWIRINADASLTVEKTAKRFGYSADHLSRICKKNFGLGARKIINRFICKNAEWYLCNTEKYIKEIAARLKFEDDKAFIAFFQYHEGCSPTEYRNRFGKLHMNNL